MNIEEIMETASLEGLTLSEMRAKVRMNIAIKAFGKWQKKPPKKNITKFDCSPNLEKDFYNLYT